jgi:hypothetical protein
MNVGIIDIDGEYYELVTDAKVTETKRTYVAGSQIDNVSYEDFLEE